MLRARSGPSSSQMYVGRNTPKRETLSMALPGSSRWSGTREVGRSLGEEGAGALPHVVAGEHTVGGVELGGQPAVHVEVARVADEPLGLADRDRAALRD